MTPKNYKRGYPVAILIGMEADRAALWHIFSQVAKPQQTISINGDRKDQKALYSFHETIVNALRPVLKEGVRSVIVASPPRTNYALDFLFHIKAHHAWLNAGNKQSINRPDNRFREHATASSFFNKDIQFQRVNSGKRLGRI